MDTPAGMKDVTNNPDLSLLAEAGLVVFYHIVFGGGWRYLRLSDQSLTANRIRADYIRYHSSSIGMPLYKAYIYVEDEGDNSLSDDELSTKCDHSEEAGR